MLAWQVTEGNRIIIPESGRTVTVARVVRLGNMVAVYPQGDHSDYPVRIGYLQSPVFTPDPVEVLI